MTTTTYTIRHYDHTTNASTAAGAIEAAKQLVKTYGQGGRNPRIEAATDDAAAELVKLMEVVQVQYSVSVI